ncbi:hypothetical protein BGZ50_009713, partial [Haplosporangium sp. Z 11]
MPPKRMNVQSKVENPGKRRDMNAGDKVEAATVKDAIYEQQLKFLRNNGPFPNGISCARAFYDHFNFTKRGAGTDALRRNLHSLRNDPLFDSVRSDVQGDTFKNWETGYFRSLHSTRKTDVHAAAGKVGKRLATVSLQQGGNVLEGAIEKLAHHTAKLHQDILEDTDLQTDAPINVTLSSTTNVASSAPATASRSVFTSFTSSPTSTPASSSVPVEMEFNNDEHDEVEDVDELLYSLPDDDESGHTPSTNTKRGKRQRRADCLSAVGMTLLEANGPSRQGRLLRMSFFRPDLGWTNTNVNDSSTAQLFSDEDWREIKSDLPSLTRYEPTTIKYLESFSTIRTVGELRERLGSVPSSQECQLVHHCLSNWLVLYDSGVSPFALTGKLSESWWLSQPWGVCGQIARGVFGCYMIPGDVTGLDSAVRRNSARINNHAAHGARKRMGVRADYIWRSMLEPNKDWAIVEAAKVWDLSGQKYVYESSFKLPRQLHDVLSGRTREAGGVNSLRDVSVSGLIIGGPCVQYVSVCWGSKGENVTRLYKGAPARIHPSVQRLATSIEAIHQLLLFRTTTIRLIERYEGACDLLQAVKTRNWQLDLSLHDEETDEAQKS